MRSNRAMMERALPPADGGRDLEGRKRCTTTASANIVAAGRYPAEFAVRMRF